jgi:multiple sugar transport system permease protein
MGHKRRKQVTGWLCNVLLLLVLLFIFFPFLWLVTTSLKQPVDAFALPPTWIFKPTFENFLAVIERGFLRSFWNSVVLAFLSTLVSLLLGVPAGYSLARAQFRGKAFMGTWILLARLAPPVAFVIPLYMVYRNLHLTDTYTGLVISYLTITLPFVVWVMTGFFHGIPRELEEAARVDGCTRFGALIRVILPVATPGLATAAVFSMTMSWNQYFYPLILGGRKTITAPIMMAGFVTFEGVNWGKLAAASVVVLVPVFAFTIAAQKGIVRGLMGGAIK